MKYDSVVDTTQHIGRVRFLLGQCAIVLLERGVRHDASKLQEPEKAVFDAVGNVELKRLIDLEMETSVG